MRSVGSGVAVVLLHVGGCGTHSICDILLSSFECVFLLSMCYLFCVDLSSLGSSCGCIMKIVYSPTWDHKGRKLEQQMVYIVKEHLKHERQLLRERQYERQRLMEKWNDCIKLLQKKKNEKGFDWLKEWLKCSGQDPIQRFAQTHQPLKQ